MLVTPSENLTIFNAAAVFLLVPPSQQHTSPPSCKLLFHSCCSLTTETVFFTCLTPGIQSHLHLQLQCCTCLPHSHIYYGLLPLTVIPLLSGAYVHLSMLCSTLFLLSLQILMLSANILILCRSICLSPLQTSRGSQLIPSVIPPQPWIHLSTTVSLSSCPGPPSRTPDFFIGYHSFSPGTLTSVHPQRHSATPSDLL